MLLTVLSLAWCLASRLPAGPVRAVHAGPGQQTSLAGQALLDQIEHRAFLYFWQKSDPNTGLTNDRAHNVGADDDYTVASTASTGYALASLPIAVERKWIGTQQAYDRAIRTLRFLSDSQPNVHGWYYHFVDKRTGVRAWKCELSSIDTVLLMMGALTCAGYWPNTDLSRLAGSLYENMDWTWMRTNGGARPDKLVVSMGWNPESGFINSDWSSYDELMELYFLGLGSQRDPLPAASWRAWTRPVITYDAIRTLVGGPLFMHQMPEGYFDLRDERDSLGWDYWSSSTNATQINRLYCMDRSASHRTYGPNIWGLSACDGPKGYAAYGAPGSEDGTVSPAAAVASIIFTPQLSQAAADTMYARYAGKIWGRYGFADAFNVDRDWYDQDVIGIDLGMALVSIEDYRTGLIWRLMAANPDMRRAVRLAGFHRTVEAEPRPIHMAAGPSEPHTPAARN